MRPPLSFLSKKNACHKTKKLILKATVIDKSDNIIEFSLTNVNTNASLPDTKFEFDASKHPGVEVVNQ